MVTMRCGRHTTEPDPSAKVVKTHEWLLPAGQVTRQPPGAYSVRGHFLRVAPTFAWPLVAYLLYAAVAALTSLSGRRARRRLKASEARMRKMLTDLKVACHAPPRPASLPSLQRVRHFGSDGLRTRVPRCVR